MVKHGPISVFGQELPTQKRIVREEARQRGLVLRYEFSGIAAHGISRNDARSQLMDEAHKRAFELLKREFGASAHFWPRPKFPWLMLDFYWRKANLGVVLIGPLITSRVSGLKVRSRAVIEEPQMCAGELKNVKILRLPYYVLWHDPGKFIGEIRAALVESGKYPNL